DELVRLTAHGIVPLPGQHLGSPAINRRGEIAAVRPPGGTGTKAYFYLVVKKSFSAQPQRTYRQHTPLGGLAWGPHSSAATLSSPHPPWTWPALTDIHHQGFTPGRMSDHGEHGEEAPAPPCVHPGVQGRDRGSVPAG